MPCAPRCWAARIIPRITAHRHPDGPTEAAARTRLAREQTIAADGTWTGRALPLPWNLEEPLHWRNPRVVFVNPLSDLFHPEIAFDFLGRVFDTMDLATKHRFLVLTKRPDRAAQFARAQGLEPLANVWLGVSAENQALFDERWKVLQTVPAAHYWLSLEPLLGPIDIGAAVGFKPWIIIGCESGPRRRPCELEWVRQIAHQAVSAGCPVFDKQLDLAGRVSHDPAEWPTDLRVRQVPRELGRNLAQQRARRGGGV